MVERNGRVVCAFGFVGVLIIGGLVGVIVWQVSMGNDIPPKSLKSVAGLKLMYEENKTSWEFTGQDDERNLVAQAGKGLDNEDMENCAGGATSDNYICQKWSNEAQLTITRRAPQSDIVCHDVMWEAKRCVSQVIQDCFNMADAHWYGGAQDWYQYWPLELWERDVSPYVAGDSYARQIGGVMERYFFNTNGFAIFIDKEVPLYVSINNKKDGKLCLISKYGDPYNNYDDSLPHLKYTVCRGSNAKSIHKYMSKVYFKRASEIPDERLFTSPIWSTWAQFKKDINQSIVLQFADDILSNDFPHSQIEIDDDWTVHYGDMDFNKDKFPDPGAMVKELTNKGFRTTMWVHTFANIDSMAFQNGSLQRFFVTEPRGKIPALVSWWRGDASAILDVTNPAAVNWYLDDLKYLQQTYNISSFKFDAGEVPWLPAAFKTNQTFRNPDDYTTLWAELAYAADKNVRHQEVRVGSRSQHLPIFVRMLDRDSNWGYENGLRTLIPVSFTFGLLGYPFILPDMIGGNAYNGSLEGRVYPEKELFIRWLQLNALLPAMQFSIVPWNYDEEVINISRKFVQLHNEYAPEIIRLAKDYTQTGDPIIRPLWWISPNDEEAQTIDSEFLLGDEVLVAPVIEKGARSRHIYLPKGTWKDHLRNTTREGARWHKDYEVQLDELAIFTKIE